MSDEIPAGLAEYVDERGLTYQLNEADAKRLGFRKVAEDKVIDASSAETTEAPAPKRRRSTTAK